MDVKEKLVELLSQVQSSSMKQGSHITHQEWKTNEEIADHLIANGVTVQGDELPTNCNQLWIPVTEKLPENYEIVLTCDDRKNIHIMAHHHDFKAPFGIVKGNFMGYAPITHWMPLPEPPKGE